jgi:TetR/AcrR family transcriptional repressor of lmrAB and yxaGH operons
MKSSQSHRDAIVQTALRLFRQQGYAATGINQIVRESRAPKGSLYHYFPEGKASIGAETVTRAGEVVANTLAGLAHNTPGPADLVRSYGALLRGWMAQSGFRDGCPITSTLLENAPQNERIRSAGASAFANWQGVIKDSLQAHGVSEPRAARLASLAIAAFEGALIQARVACNVQPLQEAAEELALAFERAVAEALASGTHPASQSAQN